MELPYEKRTAARKSEAKQLRRAGKIPAILYGKGENEESIAIDRASYEAALRQIVKGRLATTVFTLVDPKGKKQKAIVKDIQYHVTSYDVLHLDFEILKSDVAVNVNVPIECEGAMECPGIKLGGVPRQVIRSLRVRCMPGVIPSFFSLNIAKLGMGDTLRLHDLAIPEAVRPLKDLNEVAVAIVKR